MAYNDNDYDTGGFGPGGFLTDHGVTNESPAAAATTDKGKSKSFPSKSLMPVTVKQLFEATQAHPDDSFKLNGHDVLQVTIVGQITRVENMQTNMNYEIDDGTGRVNVKHWLVENEEDEFVARNRAELRENVYVRVFGMLRSFNNSRNLLAMHMQPITDFNEVAYHFLEVIAVHLQQTKGPQSATGGFTSQASRMSLPPASMAAPASSAASSHGFMISQHSPAIQSVLEAFQRDVENQSGIRDVDIVNQLRHRFSSQEVMQAIDILVQEGHVFEIDSHRYRYAH